jgi:hypothetical protein
MVKRYPNLKEEVGSSSPECEISSLLDGKLARWSTISCVLALACWSFVSKLIKSRKHSTIYNNCLPPIQQCNIDPSLEHPHHAEYMVGERYSENMGTMNVKLESPPGSGNAQRSSGAGIQQSDSRQFALGGELPTTTPSTWIVVFGLSTTCHAWERMVSQRVGGPRRARVFAQRREEGVH